jgi:hypothetical protein
MPVQNPPSMHFDHPGATEEAEHLVDPVLSSGKA